ncbi:glycine betaine/proline transport system permease protein [Orenia metallireducens]|uniref:Glycine betaine/proline transport system permease protein n=1 Tax=Orenia metallireducens TaxID=1413210 RepID=A0A285HGY8_9FIRM|nr:proline/glycine betaine ABC transporter permease [Orenia metallireducens]PRX27154.1 glycine betaine/proline transport system permease protein [Orenia metallireducens]SNY34985.1 glycine betaine/proline transport system permease protein [Orenia metallireducens]
MYIRIGAIVEKFIDLLLLYFGGFFEMVSQVVGNFMAQTEEIFLALPPLIIILLFVGIAWFLADKKVATFTLVGLLLIFSMGLWVPTIQTFVLVFVATVISLLLGIPMGILMSNNDFLDKLLTPVLDFMQTMPPFVYLIPAVMFFGIGNVPGIMATVIFSMPPAIRLTKLGLSQVPSELEEVGHSFGSNPWQMLLKIKLPLALPAIMTGINQSIMLSLSMVVIASMIGASGLGAQVLNGIQRMEIGVGFEAGLAVVILAIILDRVTSGISQSSDRVSS